MSAQPNQRMKPTPGRRSERLKKAKLPPGGSFILIPGGVTHDFENRGETRAGMLNFSIPGSFESHMPSIAQWFAEIHPKMPASNQTLQFTAGRRVER